MRVSYVIFARPLSKDLYVIFSLHVILWQICMSEIEKLSIKLKALSHPMALKIASLLAKEGEDMYLNQIAKSAR